LRQSVPWCSQCRGGQQTRQSHCARGEFESVYLHGVQLSEGLVYPDRQNAFSG
jgi:hypothetical protein